MCERHPPLRRIFDAAAQIAGPAGKSIVSGVSRGNLAPLTDDIWSIGAVARILQAQNTTKLCRELMLVIVSACFKRLYFEMSHHN
jgi:hypothetical protein